MDNQNYEQLQESVIKILFSKRFSGRYKEIINDIHELEDYSKQSTNQEISYSEVMYQVRFLKGKYSEELKDVISQYQEIIFPDFSFKTDINALINGLFSLKLWLTRYLCLKVLKISLCEMIDEEDLKDSITAQYQAIDVILFNEFINVKV